MMIKMESMGRSLELKNLLYESCVGLCPFFFRGSVEGVCIDDILLCRLVPIFTFLTRTVYQVLLC